MKYLFTAIFLATTLPAMAQTICDTRTKLVTELKTKHAEFQTGYGITQSGKQMLELFTSNSGSWTILMTRAGGISCAMAVGQSWSGSKKNAGLPAD